MGGEGMRRKRERGAGQKEIIIQKRCNRDEETIVAVVCNALYKIIPKTKLLP